MTRQPRLSSDPLVIRERCTGRDRCHWDRNSMRHSHRPSTVLLIVGSASVDSVHTDWDHYRSRRSNRTRHLRLSNVRPAQRRPQPTPTDTERWPLDAWQCLQIGVRFTAGPDWLFPSRRWHLLSCHRGSNCSSSRSASVRRDWSSASLNESDNGWARFTKALVGPDCRFVGSGDPLPS